ncbi:MAG: thymidine phosphorylase [Clostridia bacterium]|nr:thymidine phosphorylase [Clostridia bacterium]
MRMVDLIIKKKRGEELSCEELNYIIAGYCAGDVEEYQMSAFMMAVCFRGMTRAETAHLTEAMLHSGAKADLSSIAGVKVDKHSTGGVGDTTTLVVAPLVAACGGVVAKMSGRGLGHTGGTLDKLESIPGVRVERSVAELREIVERIGVCVIGQSADLVPADRRMYALRDVTGTVDSVPLIASSIMSKKLAAGTDAILLDVKVGSGAFSKTMDSALELARTMVGIGKRLNRRTVAVITDMSQPLGMAVGNGLEVLDAVKVLRGEIGRGDLLYEICMLLARHMLLLGGVAETEAEAARKLERALESGEGLRRLKLMVEALGGDAAYIDHPERLVRTRRRLEVTARRSGYVETLDALKIGAASSMLGAGRARKGDAIDHSVGIELHKRVGDPVASGEPLMTLLINDEARLDEALALADAAYSVGAEPVAAPAMVRAVIDDDETEAAI